MRFDAGGARLAALKLAQMSWFDRRWILLQLPKQQREQVKTALTELNNLNISNKAELLQQLLSHQSTDKQEISSAFRQSLLAFSAAEQSTITDASKALLATCLDKVPESAI